MIDGTFQEQYSINLSITPGIDLSYFTYDDNYMNSYSSAYKSIVRVRNVATYNTIIAKSSSIPLTGFVYKYPLSLQPVVQNHKKTFFNETYLQNSILFSSLHICPPNYPELSLAKVKKICSYLNSIS